MHTVQHSRKWKTWNVLSSRISSSGSSPAPASSQGGAFPISMPVLSISVCQGIQVGVYPLHTRRTFPISFLLSQDSLDLVMLLVSVVRGVFPSLPSLLFPPPPISCILFSFLFNPERPKKRDFCDFLFQVIVSVSPRLQLYGEYREQLGNFARREAARLLTERQWRRQAGDTTATARKGHGRRHHHHHHHPVTLESHHSHASSTKKPRPYSKCQGDQLIYSNTHIYMLNI